MGGKRDMVAALHRVEDESRERIAQQVRTFTPEEIDNVSGEITPPLKPRRTWWGERSKE